MMMGVMVPIVVIVTMPPVPSFVVMAMVKSSHAIM